MITKTELVTMSEKFIEILANEDAHYFLWKDSPYITISRTHDGELTIVGHKDLGAVREDIAGTMEERSGWFTDEIWDLRKKVQIQFEISVVTTFNPSPHYKKQLVSKEKP